ncbi:MAG: FixJ family two-component response regulator [Gammaproteobacteria bacterium]
MSSLALGDCNGVVSMRPQRFTFFVYSVAFKAIGYESAKLFLDTSGWLKSDPLAVDIRLPGTPELELEQQAQSQGFVAQAVWSRATSDCSAKVYRCRQALILESLDHQTQNCSP